MIRKEKRNRNQKSRLLIIGSLLLLFGIVVIGGKYIYNYLSYKEEIKVIDEFLETEVEEITIENVIEETPEEPTTKEEQEPIYNYIAVLEIPTINLKKGLLSIDDKNNNVDKNIEVLQNSDMPNVKNGLLALAGHSGNSKIAFFNKLHKVKKDDLVYIYYNNIKYTYKITSITRQTKQGFVTISRKKDTTELLLTTCDQNDKNKQVVVMASLIDESNY